MNMEKTIAKINRFVIIKALTNIQIKIRGFLLPRCLKGAATSTKQSLGKVELVNGSCPFKLYETRKHN